jgi:hypothetical protein
MLLAAYLVFAIALGEVAFSVAMTKLTHRRNCLNEVRAVRASCTALVKKISLTPFAEVRPPEFCLFP